MDPNSSLAFLLNPLPGSIQTFTKDGIRYQAIETNGRHYHAWKAGKYPFPCDLTARDSNNILNGLIYLHCYKAGGLRIDAALNEVVMGPLVDFVEGPPRRILDLGCGTGIWVSDTARRFRGAMVIGVDIVDGQDLPLNNVIWHVPNSPQGPALDLDEDLSILGLGSFDYVRMAQMNGVVADEQALLHKAFALCVPATGHIELSFVDWTFRNSSGPLPTSNPLARFHQLLTLASRVRRVDLNPDPSKIPAKLAAAGFTDLIHQTHTLHLTPRSRDTRQFRIGELMTSALDLEGLGLELLTRYLGMTVYEARGLIDECERYLHNPETLDFVEFHTWTARKPGEQFNPNGLWMPNAPNMNIDL